jgi:hypothetical protein
VTTEPIPKTFAAVALDLTNDALMDMYDVDRDTVRAWRKALRLHQPRGKRTLPIPGQWDTSLGLYALARACGWGSPQRFAARLLERRPEIHAAALANSRKAQMANLRRGKGETE